MIDITCVCGHQMSVADDLAGKVGKCPKCKARIEIPFPVAISQRPQIPVNPASFPVVSGQIEKFKILSTLITVIEAFAVISVGVGLLVVLVGINSNKPSGAAVGGVPFIASGVITFMMAEGLRVLIEIERNTRRENSQG